MFQIRSGQPCVPLNIDTLDTTDQLALQQELLKVGISRTSLNVYFGKKWDTVKPVCNDHLYNKI